MLAETRGGSVCWSAPLSVTADDKSNIYGAGLPALTASYSGLVNGDAPSVVGGEADVIGSGTVSVSAANGVLANDAGPGQLTVTAGSLTGAELP